MTKTVELYNLEVKGKIVGNGWLVRVVFDNGKTNFFRYGKDEVAARLFAQSR